MTKKDSENLKPNQTRLQRLLSEPGGKSIEQMAQQAERQIQSLRSSFVEATKDACRLAREAIMESFVKEDYISILPQIKMIAHDIKGQAALFGYPKVSEIAAGIHSALMLAERESDGSGDRWKRVWALIDVQFSMLQAGLRE